MKYTVMTCIVAVCVRCGIVIISAESRADDLLETSYKQAKYYDYVVNLGTTRDSVGKAFLRDWYNLWTGKSTDPIIIRVIKWFLEIIVILWVPLLIFTGIKYIMAAGDEWAQKKARSFGINVMIGIVLALSSLAIVTLISSILNDTRLGQT